MRVVRGCLSYKRCWCVRAANIRAMANNEETPMLQNEEQQIYNGEKSPESKHVEEKADVNEPAAACGFPVGPVGEAVVLGEPIAQSRQPWSTGFLSCLGSNDEFCMSDMQVCLLGWGSPCVLYASNMELLYPGQGSFISHCMAYSSLLAIGNLLCNTSLAPCISSPSRIALRKIHNLEGHGENFVKSVGCCSGLISSDEDREECDSFCDSGLHFICHQCALCQEGREIRRRTAYRGLRPHSYTLAAPSQQTME